MTGNGIFRQTIDNIKSLLFIIYTIDRKNNYLISHPVAHTTVIHILYRIEYTVRSAAHAIRE